MNLRTKKLIQLNNGSFFGGINDGDIDQVTQADASRFDSEAEIMEYMNDDLDWMADELESLSPVTVVTIIERAQP